ncbi:MAG: PEP-CTERM sorting domain-containing protein [Fimbriimonadales bacterium]
MNRVYAALIAVSVSVSASAIIVDDFEAGPFDEFLSDSYISLSGLPEGSTIGGTRAVSAFDTGGTLRVRGTAGTTGNLIATVTNSAFFDVFWLGSLADGVPPAGSGTLLPTDFNGFDAPVDLTGLNFFRIGYDTGGSNDFQINVHAYNPDLSESVSSQFIPIPTGSGYMFVSFNVFSGGGMYDSIGGVRVSIEALDSGELTLSEMEIVAVPEPATIFAFGAGLALLILARRRS